MYVVAISERGIGIDFKTPILWVATSEAEAQIIVYDVGSL
jgi:hypothetical protein